MLNICTAVVHILSMIPELQPIVVSFHWVNWVPSWYLVILRETLLHCSVEFVLPISMSTPKISMGTTPISAIASTESIVAFFHIHSHILHAPEHGRCSPEIAAAVVLCGSFEWVDTDAFVILVTIALVMVAGLSWQLVCW